MSSRLLAIALLLCMLLFAPTVFAASGDGRIVYGVSGNTNPQTRVYTGSTNSFGAAGGTVTQATPVVVRTATVFARNEMLAGYVTSGGVLYMYRWNGSSWSNEWNVTVGGNGTTGRRFDIAYERSSGDAIVVYSNNSSGNNELRYRVWNGSSWTAATNLNSAQITGIPLWVRMESRPGTDEIGMLVADDSRKLTAMVWDGNSWGSEHTAPLTTNLDDAGTNGDVECFDLAYESLSGDLLVVWGDRGGSNGTNGVRYATKAAGGGTWSNVGSEPGSFSDDATNLDLASDPSSNYILFASIGDAGSDLQYGAWDGSAWVNNVANADTTCATPVAGSRMVATGWLQSGATVRGIVAYSDAGSGPGASSIDYSVYEPGTGWTIQSDFSPNPSIGFERQMDIARDPFNSDRFLLTFSDANSDLWVKRLVMTATPAFTWTDTEGGSALTATLPGINGQAFSFSYDRLVITTTVGDGTNPGNANICPAPNGTATMLDAFTLQTNTGTDTVTAATVNFADGTTAGIGLVEITNDGGGTVYGSQTNPSDPQSISLNIAANQTQTQYKVRITPKNHTAMPAPPGASYAVTGVISDITVTNSKALNDTASATVTIDNLSTGNATWGLITPGNGQVALNWTNPGDSDFNQVVILRSTASISDAPTEGAAYIAGNTIGASTVVHVGSGVSFTDTSVTNGTAYWYKIFAKDNCGNYATGAETGPYTPQTPVGPVTPGTPTATADHCQQITVTAPFTGDFPDNGSTQFERGTTQTGPWVATTPACSTVTGPTPRTCVDTGVSGGATYYYRVTFTDPDGVNGTNPQVTESVTTPPCTDTTVQGSTAVASSCNQITVTSPFIGDSDDDGSTKVEYSTSSSGPWTSGCGTLTGSSPRQCLVSSLAPSTNYYVLITWTDPDGVSNTPPACGTNCEKLGPITTRPGPCGTTDDTAAPTLLVVAPAKDAILGGQEKVKVRVYEKVALASTDPVQWSMDGGAFRTDSMSISPNYNCGPDCSVYEIDIDTTTFSNNFHYITIQATDAAGNVAQVTRSFKVNNLGSLPAGSGKLLRRTYSSQLCMDCHNLPTHSSQAAGTKYGNWAIDCLTCHTPHNSTNIFLLRDTVRTPNSGKKAIAFKNRVPGGSPAESHLGTGAPNYEDGICETCHTRTDYHRNNATGDHSHNASVRCMNCHGHGVGFAPGGGNCRGCHGTTTQGGRRAVDADFSKNSHHVGDGGTYMGGGLSNYDCAVCHAEGTVVANKTASQCTTDGWETCLDTTEYHRNSVIDLKDADNTVTVYSYDKDSIPGAASTWNSGNPTWVTETSTHLDPFCLSCHDSDGAVANYAGDCVPNNASHTVNDCQMSPFSDFDNGGTGTTILISNNYDRVNRKPDAASKARVVDIKSRVKDNSTSGNGVCAGEPGCADRDLPTEPRYLAGGGPDGIADPPQGIYSRHAIRGQSVSVYKTTTANWNSTTYWNRTNFSWNSTSVMGCADCHTVDGANTTAGNAHGSNSEYLLKNATGGATEGNSATTYVCAQCHNSSWYEPNNHTTNGNNFEDYTAQTGISRVPVGNNGGNIYGYACGNCHGGVRATPVSVSGDTSQQFGTIHGTSQKFGIGTNGTEFPSQNPREAYRFTNGNSMRYYQPGSNGAEAADWAGTNSSCYTLSSGETPNDFGGCTKHSGGTGMSKPTPGRRPIRY